LDWVTSEALSWRDLLVIVNQLPRTSALYRSMYPDEAPWGLEARLLAAAVNALRDANWQRQGDNRAPRPSYVLMPGEEQPNRETDKQNHGSNPIPADEIARRLGWEVTDG